MRERERRRGRKSERKREKDREKERERERVCVREKLHQTEPAEFGHLFKLNGSMIL